MNKTLAYRLRNSVTCAENDGLPWLVLNFPLKVLRLDSFWKPLLHSLSGGHFIPFETICFQFASIPPQKIENFLNGLVEKGFLEFEGLSPLTEFPFVSVIISVRNRPGEITACLESLLRVDYPAPKLEILVIDDNSDDQTPEVISGFPTRLLPLKEHKQASYCRNLGAREALGEILAFIDSDCQADRLWLKELIPAFKDPTVGAVGGMVEAHSGKKPLDRYENVRSSLKIGTWFKRSRKEDRFFYLPSCNLLARREPFLKLGGFREDLFVGEDVDFCWRLQDDGWQIEYRPQGRIYHRHRNNLIPFCRRRFDYGTSEPWLQRQHNQRSKHLPFFLAQSLFWAFFILGCVFLSWPLILLSSGILLLDAAFRFTRWPLRNISPNFNQFFGAAFRSYLVFFYYWIGFFSRYYLMAAFLLMFFWPFIAVFLIGLHFLNGAVEFFIKKPRLNFFSFLFYFTLEQVSYQFGVWWGCLKNRCFLPVNPKLTFKPVFREG